MHCEIGGTQGPLGYVNALGATRLVHWLILVAPSCLRSHNARYIMLKSLINWWAGNNRNGIHHLCGHLLAEKNNSSCILGNDYFKKYPAISEIKCLNIFNKTYTMAAIWQRTILNAFSWMKIWNSDSNSTEICSQESSWQKTALVQVMDWHRTGDKPLSEIMLTQFTDAALGRDELMTFSKEHI